MTISYAVEPDLSVDAYIDILMRSTLALRRPVDKRHIMERMIAEADLIVTARDDGGALVGLSRSLTDFAYCTYLSDLAVDVRRQKQGIGRELIERTHDAAGRHTTVILIAAPAAKDYYAKIGMQHNERCWVSRRIAE
ncbi:MAG: GNAT family N-acetyltransferase [Phycisphaerales bacterium]|nr:GNAT family N-acetyltransferase [Phycisphaerales bacterium]